jgi:tol-pal system protein YbgF
MVRFNTGSVCAKTMMVFLLFFLPGCASMHDTMNEQQDPRISILQRENRQLVQNQMSMQEAVEETYKRLDALDAKIDFLENQVQQISQRQEAMAGPLNKVAADTGKTSEKEDATKQGQVKPKKDAVTTKVASKKKTKQAVALVTREAQRQYDQAYSAYVAKRYDEALALFKHFLKNHPEHDLADNAQYWVGEIYYDLENYPSAILEFKEVVTKYGEQSKAPDALLKIGYAYMALDDPNNARLFLKRVIKNYPFSDAEGKARIKLKEIDNL